MTDITLFDDLKCCESDVFLKILKDLEDYLLHFIYSALSSSQEPNLSLDGAAALPDLGRTQ